MRSFHHIEMDGASQGSLATPSTCKTAFGPVHQPFTQHRLNNDFSASILRGTPYSATVGQLPLPAPGRRANRSSATWTSSSGDLTSFSDTDDVQDRPEFVQAYNGLAKRHGIRRLATQERSPLPEGCSSQQHRRGWFSRTFLRQASGASIDSSARSDKRIRQKRSVGDVAMNIVHGVVKRDSLKDEDLQSLIRLCGKSMLHLPSEYAPGSLILPTCFRATAQYLVEHAADTRGVFRIPGSIRVVNALYGYYCAEGDPDEISSTIRCPNLPLHIKAGTHDVASVFKRLLSGLPSGILGSLALFDALVAIHSQLKDVSEFTRTKQIKLRARLIALAVGGVRSQFRRELICAVFGLLCLIGRTTEKAPREDEHGRPLPTADLMGYNALGIVFGPLLVRTKRERRWSKALDEDDSRIMTVDEIHVANAITEMLITHWREVVKHMRSLGVLRISPEEVASTGKQTRRGSGLRLSASESFVIRKPVEWSCRQPPSVPFDMSESPVPPSPTREARRMSGGPGRTDGFCSSLVVPRTRPKGALSLCSSRCGTKASLQLLSPTAEEPPLPPLEQTGSFGPHIQPAYSLQPPSVRYAAPMEEPRLLVKVPSQGLTNTGSISSNLTAADPSHSRQDTPERKFVEIPQKKNKEGPVFYVPVRQRRLVVSKDSIRFSDDPDLHQTKRGNPERQSLQRPSRSPPRLGLTETTRGSPVIITDNRRSRQSAESILSGSKDGRFRMKIAKLRKSVDSPSPSLHQSGRKDVAVPPKKTAKSVTEESEAALPILWETDKQVPQRVESKSIGVSHSSLSMCKLRHLSSKYTDIRDLKHAPAAPAHEDGKSSDPLDPEILPKDSDKPGHKAMRPHDYYPEPNQLPVKRSLRHGNSKGPQGGRVRVSPRCSVEYSPPQESTSARLGNYMSSGGSGSASVETTVDESCHEQAVLNGRQMDQKGDSNADSPRSTLLRTPTRDSRDLPCPSTQATLARSRPDRLTGSAVKAMAAKFESASQDPVFVPSPMRSVFRPSGIISRYTVNRSPKKDEKYPISPERLTRSSSSHSIGMSLPSAIRDRTSRDSTETFRMEGLDDIYVLKRDRKKRQGIGDTFETSESYWIRRNETQLEGHEAGSRASGEGFRGVMRDDTSISLESAMKALAESKENPQSFEQNCRSTTASVVSFWQTMEAPFHPRATFLSDSSGFEAEIPPAPATPPVGGGPALSPSPGSWDLALHAQIRSLQKQVVAKKEEANHLRRLLEAKQGSDTALLRAQLRLAERDRAMWRERAEKAEKRVGVFERVTARVKKLREDMANREGEGSPKPAVDGATEVHGRVGGELEFQGKEENEMERWLERTQRESSAEHTEGGGAVAERIRRSLRAKDANSSGTDEDRSEDEVADNGSVLHREAMTHTHHSPRLLCHPFHGSSTSGDGGRLSATVASMWMAAEEMLEDKPKRRCSSQLGADGWLRT